MSENKFLSAAASENLARIQAIQEKIARTYHSPFLDTVFRTLEQPEIAHIINSPAYKQMTKNIERINKAFNPYSTPLLQSVLLDLREQYENIPSLPPYISKMIDQQQEVLKHLEKLNINPEEQDLSSEGNEQMQKLCGEFSHVFPLNRSSSSPQITDQLFNWTKTITIILTIATIAIPYVQSERHHLEQKQLAVQQMNQAERHHQEQMEQSKQDHRSAQREEQNSKNLEKLTRLFEQSIQLQIKELELLNASKKEK